MTVRSLSDREVEAIRSQLARRAEIRVAYLFGSSASGSMHAESDVDVAVLVEPDALTDLEAALPYGYQSELTFIELISAHLDSLPTRL